MPISPGRHWSTPIKSRRSFRYLKMLRTAKRPAPVSVTFGEADVTDRVLFYKTWMDKVERTSQYTIVRIRTNNPGRSVRHQRTINVGARIQRY